MSLVLPPPHPWQPQPHVISGVFFIWGETCWSLASSYCLSVRGRQEVDNSLSPVTSKEPSFHCRLCTVELHSACYPETHSRCLYQMRGAEAGVFLFGDFSFQDGIKFWSHCVQVSLQRELQWGNFRTWRRWPKAGQGWGILNGDVFAKEQYSCACPIWTWGLWVVVSSFKKKTSLARSRGVRKEKDFLT